MTLSNVITEIHEHDDIVTEVRGGSDEQETEKGAIILMFSFKILG